jgi:Raf kinase inhibitor-like YbhB/YbcL family protein
MKYLALSLALTLSLTSCASPTSTASVPLPQTSTVPASTQELTMPINLSSSAFTAGLPIPVDYSCKGRDISPELRWTEPLRNTQSFALIMDDPDAPAGTWVHWVIYNIPATARGLPEAVPTDAQLADGSIQGMTSSGSAGYHGPCPPSGTHRYFFKLYALDTMLSLPSADKDKLLRAIENHILDQAELMGTFSK